jgi:hypothetical protein
MVKARGAVAARTSGLVQALPVPGVLPLAGRAGRAARDAREIGVTHVDAATCAYESERLRKGGDAVQAEVACTMTVASSAAPQA